MEKQAKTSTVSMTIEQLEALRRDIKTTGTAQIDSDERIEAGKRYKVCYDGTQEQAWFGTQQVLNVGEVRSAKKQMGYFYRSYLMLCECLPVNLRVLRIEHGKATVRLSKPD